MNNYTKVQLSKYFKLGNIKVMTFSLVISLAMIVGCEGPQGPQGEQGPQGPQGPQGDEGTANVIYSSWSGLDSAVRDTTIDSSNLKIGDINAPELTQEILDEGAVKVYMKFSEDVYPLPYTNYAGGKANTLDFLPELNLLYITRFTHDNSADVGLNSSLEFRYVLIPGGQSAGGEANTNTTVEALGNMSYEELQQRFNIPNSGSGKIRLH